MAEVTSGNDLTVLVLDDDETSELRLALYQWGDDRIGEEPPSMYLYDVMEALGVNEMRLA